MDELVTKEELEQMWAVRMMALLDVCSNESECRDCGRAIWWVTTKNDRRMPYTGVGIPHWDDCPAAEERRARARQGLRR